MVGSKQSHLITNILLMAAVWQLSVREDVNEHNVGRQS